MTEYDWLEHVHLTADVINDEVVSWSAYHASQTRGPMVQVSLTSLMPSLATVKDSLMTKTKNLKHSEIGVINVRKHVPQFKFWSSILSLELLVFCFVRAYRESDFQLYRETLSELIPFFFALDHINYARWLPVHLRDMLALEQMHPGVYTEFSRGHFAVRKTEKAFSMIAIDLAHEQSNAVIKGDGGAIGLTEDKAALRRWMVAGPEISRLVDEFSVLSGKQQTKKSKEHHEETFSFQKVFLAKVNKLKDTISELGNPFEKESTELYALDKKEVADSCVNETMNQLLPIGQKQYEKFVKDKGVTQKPSYNEPVTKNKLRLFSRKAKPNQSSAKLKLDSLKDECQLFSRLFISCQSRKCDLQDFFRHENKKCPPSISQNGKLYCGVKSQLLEVLEQGTNKTHEQPNADTVIIDGAALINAKSPGAAKTFDDYAADVIVPHIETYTRKYSRVDVVFDIYPQDSLKGETRQKRGTGIRRKVAGKSRPPKSWNNFLTCDENKTEIFEFLADKIILAQTNVKIIVPKGDDIACNLEINRDMLAPCNHEEADTHMFVHAKHASLTGSRILTIVSSDTDVVVLAIAFADLNIDALWLAFGKGDNFRWMSIHDICKQLGPRSRALPYFHALTGCDTVSPIVGKGKKSAWQAWNVD